ncbi:MAG: hypothetical protein ACYTFG_07990 [Planctomycetota bacterium]|jgi:hypothetical protein
MRVLLLIACFTLPLIRAEGGESEGEWKIYPLRPVHGQKLRLAAAAPLPARLRMPFAHPGGGFELRPEGRTLRADLDGDGILDAVTEEGEVFKFLVQDRGGKPLSYLVRFYRGAKRAWFLEPATVLTCDVEGEPLTFIDTNLDLRFHEEGVDAVMGKGSPWAIPLGKVMHIGSTLHHVEVDSRSRTASVRPFTGPKGTVDLREGFRSPGALTLAVVKCGSSYFDVATREKTPVPTGKYELLRGRLETPEKSCAILRGNMKPILVEAGALAAPAWGRPVRIDFEAALSDGKMHVSSVLRYFGSLGEEYGEFSGPLTTPKIEVISPEGRILARSRFETG